MSNEFDDAVAAAMQLDRGQAARVGFFAAVDTNPDAYAEAKRVAERTGVPVDTVLAMPTEIKRQDAMSTINFDTLAKTSPATAAILANAERAKVAHDDIENLSSIERTFLDVVKDTGVVALKSVIGLPQSFVGILDIPTGGTVGKWLDDRGVRFNEASKIVDSWYSPAQQRANAAVRNADGFVNTIKAAINYPSAAFTSAGESLAQMLGGGAMARGVIKVLPKTSALLAGAAGEGIISAGGAAESIRAQTPDELLSVKQALSSLGSGAMTAVFGAMGGKLAQRLGIDDIDTTLARGNLNKGSAGAAGAAGAAGSAGAAGAVEPVKRSFIARLAAGGISEGLFEEFPQSAQEKMWQNFATDRPLLDGVGNAGAIGLLSGAAMGSGFQLSKGIADRLSKNKKKVADAQKGAEFLSTLNKLAAANKVLARDRETFEQFILEASNNSSVKQVFISAKTLMQSGVATQVSAVSPAVAAQLSEALKTGGEIVIPIEEYAARIAPTEHAQTLLDHLRVEPQGFSHAEAQAFIENLGEELRAEIERTLAAKQGDETFKASAEAVRAEVKTELDTTRRFSTQVNDSYSAMISNFYAATAAKLGTTPQELFKQYPLKVRAKRFGGPQFDQSEGPFGPVMTEFKGNTQGAIAKLMEMKSGEAIGALHHPDIGDIDLVWGEEGTAASDGYGLAKLAKYHPEVLNDLQGIIAAMKVTTRNKNRVNLESADHRAAVRLTWDSQAKHWLLTAFQKKEGGATSTTTDTAGLDGKGDTARLSDASDSIIDQKLKQFYQPSPDNLPARAIVGRITGEEIAPRDSDINTLRTAAREWYEDNLRNTSVVHIQSGHTVEFKNARKAFSTSADPVKLQLFAALRDVIANGEIHTTTESTDPNEVNVKAYHWLTAWVEIDGVEREVGITLRENHSGHLYYNHNPIAIKVLTEIEEKASGDLSRTRPANKAEGSSDLDALNQTVSLNDSDVNLYLLNQAPRGSFNPATLTITLSKKANLSTFLHESGHFFLEVQTDIVSKLQQKAKTLGMETLTPGERQMLNDTDALLHWFGVKTLAEWNKLDFEAKRPYHEKFARGFEAYLFEGKAPSIELEALFQKFRTWLVSVYRELKALNVALTDDVRGVFDRMLATDEQIMMAEQSRSMRPLFTSAEEIGLTPEEFAVYQALAVDATNDAIQDLQARALRDMSWIGNAGSSQRAQVMMDVRREVMSQPIYRAWTFLTGRIPSDDNIHTPKTNASPDTLDETKDSLFVAIAKLGGLHKEEVIRAWGIDPNDESLSDVSGKPLWHETGGLSIDEMAKALSQYGYLQTDENGRWDLADFENVFNEELSGNTQYSIAFDDSQYGMRPGEQLANPMGMTYARLDIDSLQSLYSTDRINKATPKRQAASLNDAKSVAEQFIGKRIKNQATGLEATVSKTTLGKMTSKKAVVKSTTGGDHALAVANADSLFASAVFGETHADRQGESTIVGIHRYYAPMITPDGRVLAVKLTVKETTGKNEPNPLYTIESIDVEKPALQAPDDSGIERGIDTGTTTTTGGFDETLSNIAINVNSADSQQPLPNAIIELIHKIKRDLASESTITARIKARGMTATNGLHPDIAAEIFGFTSGDELVRKLANAESPKALIKAITNMRMLEQFGELSSLDAIEKAADRAIHNEARARFVATEVNILAKATGQHKVLRSAVQEYASTTVSGLRVRTIEPNQYASAEVRAAKAADKAIQSGDLAIAATEKGKQLIQLYATRAAYEAKEEIDTGLRYLKRLESDINNLDTDYAEQISNLLERFDLQQSNNAIEKHTSLVQWIEKQREAGFEPEIPNALKNEAFRTSYKNLTVKEFRGLIDTVQQIEHLGHLKHRLLTASNQHTYEAVCDEIASSIRAHTQKPKTKSRAPTTKLGIIRQGIKEFFASHIKAATWARIMDGGKDGGPMWEYLVRSANKCGDQETTMRAEATAKLSAILAPVSKLGKMSGNGQYFETIDRSLNRTARIVIALNMGNEGNIQRLLGGEGWTIEQITPVLQSLTTEEWQAVQAVWDHCDSYRPLIAAKEHRVYGKAPDWLALRPFTVTTADGTPMQMRGGYYPIKYDPLASLQAEEHADTESARRKQQSAYTTASTRRSFINTPVEDVEGRPLLYTLSGAYSGINDVIHDLAWHEWLIDANRLLRSHTIDSAIRDHYGPIVKKDLKTWVQDVAEGEKGMESALDILFSALRHSSIASSVYFETKKLLLQLFNITQSIARLGPRWVARGLSKYAAHPFQLTQQ